MDNGIKIGVASFLATATALLVIPTGAEAQPAPIAAAQHADTAAPAATTAEAPE